jgi:beta-glucosidase-like glycosyl hydrolase
MQRLVVEYVTGAQNNTPGVPHDTTHSGAPLLLSGMCCKHVAAYDVEDSRYTFNASVDKRNLWESYLPAFKGCISEAKASHVMCSYNAIVRIRRARTPYMICMI